MNSTPTFEYDDLFVYLPSIMDVLTEGKSLGTARQQDLLLLQHAGKLQAFDPEAFASARKRGQTVGKRKLKKVQNETRDSLTALIAKYINGDIEESKFRKQARNLMKTAWKDVYLAGLRAGGLSSDSETKQVKLGPGDDRWLKSAMQHEMRFLNKFLTAIVDETYKMALPRRIDMYVTTLESAYDSARVMALPATALLYWTGPRDKITCPSCRYMYVNSPFTKFSIPLTPRNGGTICMTNCRDRLMVRSATMKKVKEREAELPARSTMINHLRKIKRTGKLPPALEVQYAHKQKP